MNFMDYSKIIKCANFAAVKHCNQRRKDQQETPYINHPIGKCQRCADMYPRRYFVDILNSQGYGEDTDSNFLVLFIYKLRS